MSVYVDPVRKVSPTKNWPYRRACHMFATSLRELHEMAGLIGLSRSWFQSGRHFPHYDLTAWKRAQAIERGAVAVDRHFTANFVRGHRDGRADFEDRQQ
jgi:hypothetical protein